MCLFISNSGDIQYISRLIRLVKHFVPACVIDSSRTGYVHGRHCLLPFDAYHDPMTGERDLQQTTMVGCQYVKSFPLII